MRTILHEDVDQEFLVIVRLHGLVLRVFIELIMIVVRPLTIPLIVGIATSVS